LVHTNIVNVDSEVFKARCKKTKKLVALKKVLMENEKEGVSCSCLSVICHFPLHIQKEKLLLMKNTGLNKK